ncbi:hypothetical protein DVA86_33800 [Streptomyces armeniacus]|uniref:DUF2637 domain-containing protein n=1 Tax=Streptomyces armeniacus TaxID=83291 RepID=A0A345Y1U8_9ACTN|nr:hypothetical protein DVA86_33800 [Streptomyces armeniacus]
MLHRLTILLCAVGVLALTFTAVNVTLFASSRDVPLPIAVLLDPMLALTLTAVLYADSRLAAWGLRPPTWSTALRWWAGATAAVMNTWASLWPDGHIGWPHQADPAAVLLHLAPCLLLVGLAEAIAAYRRLLTETRNPNPQPVTAPRPEPPPRSVEPPLHPAPHTAPGGDLTRDDELLLRAHALDAAVRTRTGHPVSIRELRRQLHLGQDRARALRTRLDAALPDDATAPDPHPETSLDQGR